jgi:hypothetical protein
LLLLIVIATGTSNLRIQTKLHGSTVKDGIFNPSLLPHFFVATARKHTGSVKYEAVVMARHSFVSIYTHSLGRICK